MTARAGCLLGLGDSSISVHAEGEAGERLVAFLFPGAPAAGSAPAAVGYDVTGPDEAGALTLNRDGSPYFSSTCAGELAGRLLDRTLFDITSACASGAVLHAAGVAGAGGAAILSGGSGSGKTTLATWLAGRGLDCLSDELLYVTPEGGEVHAYPRPLMIKHGALPVLEARLDLERRFGDAWYRARSDQVVLLPSAWLTGRPARLRRPLACIVFPRYLAGGGHRLRPLGRAQAATRLMQSLLNARNLAGHGVALMLRLVARVPAYELLYSDLDRAGEDLERLLG